MKPFLSLFACAALAACAGDVDESASGLAADQPITELTDVEWTALCEWSVGLLGEERSVDCGDSTVTFGGSVDECEAENAEVPEACSEITVSDLEACIEVLASTPCDALTSAECLPFLLCSIRGDS